MGALDTKRFRRVYGQLSRALGAVWLLLEDMDERAKVTARNAQALGMIRHNRMHPSGMRRLCVKCGQRVANANRSFICRDCPR